MSLMGGWPSNAIAPKQRAAIWVALKLRPLFVSMKKMDMEVPLFAIETRAKHAMIKLVARRRWYIFSHNEI